MGHVVSPAGLYGATARPFPRIPDRLMAIDTVGGNGHGRVLLQKRIDNGFRGRPETTPISRLIRIQGALTNQTVLIIR